jgi:hypothetical protein
VLYIDSLLSAVGVAIKQQIGTHQRKPHLLMIGDLIKRITIISPTEIYLTSRVVKESSGFVAAAALVALASSSTDKN